MEGIPDNPNNNASSSQVQGFGALAESQVIQEYEGEPIKVPLNDLLVKEVRSQEEIKGPGGQANNFKQIPLRRLLSR